MKKVSLVWVVVLALAFSIIGSFLSQKWIKKDFKNELNNTNPNKETVNNNFYKISTSALLAEGQSFVEASKKSTPAVVYIKTLSKTTVQSSPFDWFFNPYAGRSQITTGTGSGVIISKDGYIVTNNHVIDRAQEITVILNQRKREYQATLIGVDPSTDLALLKIEANALPFLNFANSDKVDIGQWVLAVGNPFNLTSTVTAGIVSAKGRNINIVNNKFPIESFIQTDAAINPGNSGGALVNLNGDLIGINTAIASKTGSYAGYGFAIPANIANKIVKDLIEFGKVKRGFSGLNVKDINFKLQNDKNITVDKGVYVESIIEDSPAENAGFMIGDIITSVGDKDIESKSVYDEVLSYYRPGDELTYVVIRGGSKKSIKSKLISQEETVKLIKKNTITSKELGADFTPINASEQKKLGIKQGIKVTEITRGYASRLSLSNGFIISKYNGKAYSKAEDLIEAMKNDRRKIEIEGYDANGSFRRMSFIGY